MKKLFLVVFLCSAFLFIGNTASAEPILQLDIYGATYDSGTETTYGGPSGDLYALLNPDAGEFKNGSATLSNTYYISLAVVPSTNSYPGSNPGFNIVEGTAVGGFITNPPNGGYGTPNLLQPHSVFDTWYWEYAFTFDGIADQVNKYNVQDDPTADPTVIPGGGATSDFLYYAKFSYDVSALLAMGGIDEIHFDLYTYDDGSIIKAPFSKDASAVPEPATLLLLGGGLVGLAGFGRKRFKK